MKIDDDVVEFRGGYMQEVILDTSVELTIKDGVLHLNAKDGCILRISGLRPGLELYHTSHAASVMRWQAGE